MTVQCASLPAIAGSYPIDATTQMQITGIAAAISAGLGLPGGGASGAGFLADGVTACIGAAGASGLCIVRW